MNKEQVVCGCFQITVGDLMKEIEKGTKTFEDAQENIKVSTGCRRCSESAKEIFYKLLDL
jgi:NAD(P)H-nitrite reductase large subunit